MDRAYKTRLLISAAICAGAYFFGLPYVYFGAEGSRCDYYGLQGHRFIFGPPADCPKVKIWELKYPIFAMYDGDNWMAPPPLSPSQSYWRNDRR